MKKLIALTIMILVIMCFIIVFNAKGVESSKLNIDNTQTTSNIIVPDSVAMEDVHIPEMDKHNQEIPIEITKTKKNREIDPKKPMVALTFDDGPHPEFTMSILDALERYDGLATFFVLGSRAEKFNSIIKGIHDSGSQIGNHTYNHRELTKLGGKTITKEITKTENILHNIISIKPSILRPTYGSVNNNVKKYSGLPLILWSIDTLDWKTRNEKKIVSEVLGKVKDGDIILMHDIYKTTAAAAEVIIKELSSREYQMVTIDELYTARGIDLVSGKVYANAYVKK